jgi:hypothetical protein
VKQSALDKAIAQLQGEIDVLQLAIAKLKAQQAKAPMRQPRRIKPVEQKAG